MGVLVRVCALYQVKHLQNVCKNRHSLFIHLRVVGDLPGSPWDEGLTFG